MASIRKCPKCGFDLTDAAATTCPMCGTIFETVSGVKTGALVKAKWIGALIQFTISTTFMLIFGFPKIMIAIFGSLILLGALFAGRQKPRQVAAASSRPPTAHPVLVRIFGLTIALCSFAFLSILLFGFVIFMNSYSRWQQYKGQSYHRSDFQVARVYYQRHGKGTDVYATGTVDGQRESMNLVPYLHSMPHDEAELYERVPTGTSIPIYFFPNLKGRLRVQNFEPTPTAEAYHQNAIKALKYGLGGLALTGGIIFVLLRLRAGCFEKNETAFAATA